VPKKILIVTEYFYPEEFKINDIVLSWKNKGYDVDVLTTIPPIPKVRYLMDIRINFIKKKYGKELIFTD